MTVENVGAGADYLSYKVLQLEAPRIRATVRPQMSDRIEVTPNDKRAFPSARAN